MQLGGLGDGLVVLSRPGQSAVSLGGRPESDFGNETLALGVPHGIKDWWTHCDVGPGERTVLLASDGVSDDLVPERLDDLVAWLRDEIASLEPRQRWHALCRELRNWPVPRHHDDKTIAVMLECLVGEGS